VGLPESAIAFVLSAAVLNFGANLIKIISEYHIATGTPFFKKNLVIYALPLKYRTKAVQSNDLKCVEAVDSRA
jgi:hypothetical protein